MKINPLWFGVFLILIGNVVGAEESGSSDKDYTWIYIGGAIGGVVLIAVIVGVVIYMKRGRKPAKSGISKGKSTGKKSQKPKIGDLMRKKKSGTRESTESKSKDPGASFDCNNKSPVQPTATSPSPVSPSPSPIQEEKKDTLMISLNEPPIRKVTEGPENESERYFQRTNEDPTIVNEGPALPPGEMV